jgi:hypothetical protein
MALTWRTPNTNWIERSWPMKIFETSLVSNPKQILNSNFIVTLFI